MDDIHANPGNYNMTYITEYTNAPHLINPGFEGPAELDGLFSGYNESKRSYDKSTWQYQLDDKGIPKKDKDLRNPNCVFQIMRKHFARYTPDVVSQITGCPVDTFLLVAQTYAASGAVGKAGTIMYAMGTTQHTYGTQNIRAYAMLQLLLGNVGVAGGGINAMRGESNVQGSTDHCLLSHILPGYLKVPVHTDKTLDAHIKRATPTTKKVGAARTNPAAPRAFTHRRKRRRPRFRARGSSCEPCPRPWPGPRGRLGGSSPWTSTNRHPCSAA